MSVQAQLRSDTGDTRLITLNVSRLQLWYFPARVHHSPTFNGLNESERRSVGA